MAASIGSEDNERNDGSSHQRLYPSFIERYFTPRYKADACGREGEDFCILQHSNKICVITIAQTHPLLKSESTVIKVDFQVSPNTNRMENKVVGKSKKGAQFLEETSALCTAHCSNGESYTMYACIRGKLVEVNETLLTRPQLLKEKPATEGYLAVILLRLSDCDRLLDGLLSAEQYAEVLASRATKRLLPALPTSSREDGSSDAIHRSIITSTTDFPT